MWPLGLASFHDGVFAGIDGDDVRPSSGVALDVGRAGFGVDDPHVYVGDGERFVDGCGACCACDFKRVGAVFVALGACEVVCYGVEVDAYVAGLGVLFDVGGFSAAGWAGDDVDHAAPPLFCSRGWIRTSGFQVRSLLLCPLSYTGLGLFGEKPLNSRLAV